MTYLVQGGFLREARQFFEDLPDITEQAVMMSINQVAERKAVPMIRRDVESQIAFPAGYLDQPDRLGVTRKANRNNLEAVITARDRATSLARFAPGQTPENSRGKPITIQVKKGRSKQLNKGFLVRLKNGNIGLATRDKSTISRAYKPVMLGRGVYLLYGPSVDQVFKAVAADSLPAIGDLLSVEFFRQFARLTRG